MVQAIARLEYQGEGGGGGSLVKNQGIATSIKASLGSLALITYLGAWKQLEMGLNLRITCTA